MILVVASALDDAARQLVAGWSALDALLLTPGDLCAEGWHVETEDFEAGRLVVDGARVPIRQVSGVLTLLTRVADWELVSIEDTDRAYAASEINAFLFYFLSRIRCPVLNRPSAYCLAGPSWRDAQWMLACRQVGFTTAGPLRTAVSGLPASCPSPEFACRSIVGREAVGVKGTTDTRRLLRLAELARVNHLTVRSATEDPDAPVQSIGLVPDVRDPRLRHALENFFTGHA